MDNNDNKEKRPWSGAGSGSGNRLGIIAAALIATAFCVYPVASQLPDNEGQQQPLLATSRAGAAPHETWYYSTPPNSATSPLDDDAFRALVADTLAAWHVPGVAVAVVDGDQTWTEGFGVAEFFPDDTPDTLVTPDTLFYTASTTKAFVAAALALMIESGNYSVAGRQEGDAKQRLDWTTPLADILLDDFVVGNDYGGNGGDGGDGGDGGSNSDHAWATVHLTVEDALAHRTGLAAHDLSRSRQYGLDPPTGGRGRGRNRNATVRDVTRSLRHLPLHTSPRTEWRYCNLMYLVLSHAVETLTGGRWLGDALGDWLWRPLGMHSTFFSLDAARAAAASAETPNQLAQGYYWEAATDQYVAVPHMPLEEVSGAGAVISSVRDYAQWLRCWIDGPAFSSSSTRTPTDTDAACGGIPFERPGLDAILAPKMFLAHTAASPAPYDVPVAYASAWTTSSYKGHRFWGHSGGSNAFGAQIYFFPDDRFGVVVFGNTAVTSNAAELILLWHLADERFGIPEDQRYDWDARFRRSATERTGRVDGALDRLYPDRARPPQPPSLPLDDYTGTYHHPAYQNMTVQLVESTEANTLGDYKHKNYNVTFTAERHNHTWPTLCEFVHVSGDHWLLYTDMLYERSGNFKSYARAWFDIGADGRAHTLVVEFWNADDDTIEGVIPFGRLEER